MKALGKDKAYDQETVLITPKGEFTSSAVSSPQPHPFLPLGTPHPAAAVAQKPFSPASAHFHTPPSATAQTPALPDPELPSEPERFRKLLARRKILTKRVTKNDALCSGRHALTSHTSTGSHAADRERLSASGRKPLRHRKLQFSRLGSSRRL